MVEPRVAVMTEWLMLAQSLGSAMLLEVQVPTTGRYLLCHVLGGTRVAQVPGSRLLGPRCALPAHGVDALVRGGWLPPSAQTMHWRWTAGSDVPVGSTARLLAATVETVLGSPGQQIQIALRPCGESTCTVHAKLTSGARCPIGVVPAGPPA